MNYQTVRNIKGQKDGKGYDVKVDMFGTFTEIGGIGYSSGGKETSVCKIRDDAGEEHKVHLYGTMPNPTLLNTRQSFSISAFDGSYQGKPYVGYSGFWNDRQAPQQPAQNAPQATPQTPQQPAQATNSPQTGKSTPDSELRRFAIELAVRMLCAKALKSDSSIYDEADMIMSYVKTGSINNAGFENFAQNNQVQNDVPEY